MFTAIRNSQNLEITQLSFKWGMYKQTVEHPYNGTSLRNKKITLDDMSSSCSKFSLALDNCQIKKN